MSKVFLAGISGEAGIRALLGDGKMLKFNIRGTCLGEFPISYGITTMQEVDVVSLLVYKDSVEVGYNIEQKFVKQVANKGIGDISAIMQNLGGVIFVGRKDGQEGETAYTQYIYAYMKGHVSMQLASIL
jgi:hypothetical protein